ncbi:hypothetical protein [Paroceanicella profunda]|uniref:hypothetical protein n=1 Tax=Paroceanicella profunda TaxID=2579971 RepID=UPI001EF09B5A|nr:hypothetical protein [Paroceanicella profunda]
MSDPAKVSPATMARIREAIELTGYVPNALAGRWPPTARSWSPRWCPPSPTWSTPR